MILYEAVTPDKYELPLYVADSIAELAAWAGVSKNCIMSSISHGTKGTVSGRKFIKIYLRDGMQKKQAKVDWISANDDLPSLGRGMQQSSVVVLVRMQNLGIARATYSYADQRWYKERLHERLHSPVVEWRSV